MKKQRTNERKKKEDVMSNLKKGELRDCSKCRFGYDKKKCRLEFPNELEVAEEVKGKCIYFCGRKK